MKVKIKNTKKNIFYNIIGRIATLLIVWGLLVQLNIKLLIYIVDNCITTL